MKIKTLFPKFNVPIRFETLDNLDGQFWFKSDCIVLNSSLRKGFATYTKIVFLHEMIHSTASRKRLMRLDRLVDNFGPYTENSLSYKVEECIAEIAGMVAAMKLGILNEYTQKVFIHGLEKYYTPDMYIPVREIRAAVKYFAADETSFEDEIESVKVYLDAFMDIKFQETYNKREVA